MPVVGPFSALAVALLAAIARMWAGFAALCMTLLVIGLVIVVIDPGAAPHDVNRWVNNPRSLHWSPITGNPCKWDGGVGSATLVNDVGYAAIYNVQCNDGVTVTASPVGP